MRLRTWQSRLDACLAERRFRPFGWGVQDCCMFAADCVEAVTGVDPAADIRGSYSDEIGAARLLERLGGVVNIAIERLGHVVPTALAQPGDVGLTYQDGMATLAVCGGGNWIVPAAHGLVTIQAKQVLRAWRCSRD